MRRIPHRCPVCAGRGSVPCGFYTPWGNSTAEDPCRSCGGTGILWGPPKETLALCPPAHRRPHWESQWDVGSVEEV